MEAKIDDVIIVTNAYLTNGVYYYKKGDVGIVVKKVYNSFIMVDFNGIANKHVYLNGVHIVPSGDYKLLKCP